MRYQLKRSNGKLGRETEMELMLKNKVLKYQGLSDWYEQ